MSKSTVTIAPYSEGNLLEWVQNVGGETLYGKPVEWRPIAPFDETLQVETFERGRSAARFILKDPAGHTYPMFMRDMLDILKMRTITKGSITDTWIVVKRGANYGVALAGVTHKRAVSWRSQDTCRKCGRTGTNGFRMVEDGTELVDAWWPGGGKQSQTKYLRDASGNYARECESTKACAERADRAIKQTFKAAKVTPEMRTAQKILRK